MTHPAPAPRPAAAPRPVCLPEREPPPKPWTNARPVPVAGSARTLSTPRAYPRLGRGPVAGALAGCGMLLAAFGHEVAGVVFVGLAVVFGGLPEEAG